jgi:hypothetical protein
MKTGQRGVLKRYIFPTHILAELFTYTLTKTYSNGDDCPRQKNRCRFACRDFHRGNDGLPKHWWTDQELHIERHCWLRITRLDITVSMFHLLLPLTVDGYHRPLFLVNGITPGPIIEAMQGETFVVTVNNMLAVQIGMHW